MGVCSSGEAVPEVSRSEADSSNPCTSVYVTLGPVTADFFLPPLQGPSFLLSLSYDEGPQRSFIQFLLSWLGHVFKDLSLEAVK